MQCHVRPAKLSDAPEACELVRRSITELCVEDHRGDVATLAEWLANKTPARFQEWILSDRHVALAAESEPGLVGFGLLNVSGYIALLYVHPEARFRGVSKALLSGLEQESRRLGICELKLESSLTALRFYQRAGYSPTGECTKGFGCTQCHPMSKMLTSA